MNLGVEISGAHDLPEPTLAVQNSPSPRSKSRKVLVVDDEEMLVEIAVAYIENIGHTALHASDAATALEILARNPDISLVITDVMMPGLTGLELVHAIRRQQPAVKVIYVTGYTPEVITQRAGLNSNDLMLRKPYRRSDLQAIIRKALAPDDDAARTCPVQNQKPSGPIGK